MMIRIKFKEPDTTIWKNWVNDCETATKKLREDYKNKKPIEITDLYKRSSIKVAVYLAKEGPFMGRCAYCETYIADFQHIDIEHFRPKKRVTDEHDVPIMIQAGDGHELEHPGYYWLAYDWHNLLPTCKTCNQPGENGMGKRNRFPIEGVKYATTDEEVADEKPLLFNPIDPNDEDPEEHFGIDFDTGIMTIKNGSKRADICIKVFGLNIRDQVVKERKDAMDSVIAKYAAIILGSQEKAAACRKALDLMEEGFLSHTLARRAQMTEIRRRIV